MGSSTIKETIPWIELTPMVTAATRKELDRTLANRKAKRLASYALSKVDKKVSEKLELKTRNWYFRGRPESWSEAKRQLAGLCPTCFETFGIFIRYECADQSHLTPPATKLAYECVEELRKRKRCRLCDLVLRRIPASATCACVKKIVSIKGNHDVCISIGRQLLQKDVLGDFDIWFKQDSVGRIRWKWKPLEVHHDARPQQGSMLDFASITRWLQQSEHKISCQASSYALTRYQIPIELLLIDTKECRLVRGQTDWEFVALSYVWGRTDMLVNEQNILPELMQEEALSTHAFHGRKIPPVVTDAMKLVSSAGERYLWVDSLCIVQDSQKKHDDMALMDVIYSRAKFTIVSLDGESASSSIPGVCPNSRRPPMLKYYSGKFTFTSVPPRLEDLAEKAVHTTRGWTYQEVILSKKRLYLSEQGTYVRCICDGSVVSSGQGIDVGKHLSLLRSPTPDHTHSIDDYCQHWTAYTLLVEGYTTRHLSYKEDILGAFAGVSSILAEALDCKFLHGAMLNMLTQYILFQPDKIASRRLNAGGEFMYPSWTWAGWEGRITWPIVDSSLSRSPKESFEWNDLRIDVSIEDEINLRYLPDGAHGLFGTINDRSCNGRSFSTLPLRQVRQQDRRIDSPLIRLYHKATILPGHPHLRFRTAVAVAKSFDYKDSHIFLKGARRSFLKTSVGRLLVIYEREKSHFLDPNNSQFSLVAISRTTDHSLFSRDPRHGRIQLLVVKKLDSGFEEKVGVAIFDSQEWDLLTLKRREVVLV